MHGSLPEFSILNWLAHLQPAGRSKSRYICPNCGGNNLSINLQSGKYKCYSGCENSEVREAIRPLKEALQEAGISPDDYQARREERIREREARQAQREREERARQAKLLSLEERDHQFRLLHKQAGSPGFKHRQLLEKRSLSQSDIGFASERGWLWTWQAGELMPFGTTADLPGVDPRKGILRSFAGFVIAALDPDGRITGLQVANDNRNPKYQWISSSGVGGNGPHLPNGELPLFCWRYPEADNIIEVWLCEGALKSLLAALFLWRIGRTDIAVIGTANAAVYGENTLREYLERLGASEIRLMPDAGAIANRQIHNANAQTLELCSSWGYQVSVGWWGQASKQQLDIDELLAGELLSRGGNGSNGSKNHVSRNCLESQKSTSPTSPTPDTLTPDTLTPPLSIKYLSYEEYINLSPIINPVPAMREIAKDLWLGLKAFRSFQDLYSTISGGFYEQATAEKGSKRSEEKSSSSNGDQNSGDRRVRSSTRVSVTNRSGKSLQHSRSRGNDSSSISSRSIETERICDRGNKGIYPSLHETHGGEPSFYNQNNGARGNSELPRTSGAIVPYRGPNKIRYCQPGDLPTFTEWVEMGKPKVEFDPGLRISCIKEAHQKGWTDLLDSSLVGKGKSYDTGLLTREDFNLPEFDEEKGEDIGGRIFHLSSDHKNPTTSTVEQNSEDLVSRHNGENLDPTRLTPGGNPYRVRTRPNEHPDIPANCPETNTFLLAHQEKDTFIYGGKGSPVCDRCPIFNSCEFLARRHEQLTRKYNLRAHPNQVGNATTEKDVAIIDEPGTLLEATKTIALNRSDISALFPALRERDRQFYNLLHKFLALVADGLGNALNDGVPNHGLSHIETLAWLGKCWGTTDEDKFHTKMWEIYQRLGESYEHPVARKLREMLEEQGSDGSDGSENYVSRNCLESQKLVSTSTSPTSPTSSTSPEDPWNIPTIDDLKQQLNKVLKNNWDKILEGCQTPEEKQQAIRDRAILNALGYFIDAVTGRDPRVNIRIDGGKYVITCPSFRHQQTIGRTKFRIYTDATISIIDLGRKTGQKNILEIAEYIPDDSFKNLTVKVVKGLGSNPKGTTAKTTTDRYLAAVNGAILNTQVSQEQVALLTFKNSLEIFQDLDIKQGYWYRDSRGNNRFTDINLLILHGLPKPNLGDMASQWHALTGETVTPTDLSGRYGYWYRQQVMAEVIQALGRPRAHLRPNDRIEVMLLAGDALSDRDINTIQQKFPGCTVEIVEAYDLAPEAASKGTQKERGIVEVAWQMVQQGVKPTLDAIARSLNTSDKNISKHAKAICDGGFKKMVKILLFLIKALKEKVEFSELDEDSQYFAQIYFPQLAKDLQNPKHTEDIVAAVASVVESFPVKQVRRILAATPPWVLCKFIGAAFKVGLGQLIDKSPLIANSSGGMNL